MATSDEGISRRRNSVTHIDVVDPAHALDLATAQSYSENVFLFVPNLIGYARVVLAALALYYMSEYPKYTTLAYSISALLDAADGHAARALGQTSKFGAVLDMVVDRCATSCLLCYLASAYPPYALLFQFLIALDFSSHYMHMYSSLATGSKSHKLVQSDVSWILWMYYNNSTTLFLVCAANELFYVALYLMKWVDSPLIASTPYIWPFPFVITWASTLAIICGPICVLKNIINCVQLWKASKILVGIDLAERAIARRELEAKRTRAESKKDKSKQ
jgi:CDP-diacylglycerol--inositol 3-phosphatidyltransferase